MFPSNRQGKLPKPYLANRMHYWMLSIILYYCIHDDSIHSDSSHGEIFPVVISHGNGIHSDTHGDSIPRDDYHGDSVHGDGHHSDTHSDCIHSDNIHPDSIHGDGIMVSMVLYYFLLGSSQSC